LELKDCPENAMCCANVRATFWRFLASILGPQTFPKYANIASKNQGTRFPGAPWGPPSFPLGAPGPTWVVLASLELHQRTLTTGLHKAPGILSEAQPTFTASPNQSAEPATPRNTWSQKGSASTPQKAKQVAKAKAKIGQARKRPARSCQDDEELGSP
jgi:hypothetical protein